jgi:hypothetical protein
MNMLKHVVDRLGIEDVEIADDADLPLELGLGPPAPEVDA